MLVGTEHRGAGAWLTDSIPTMNIVLIGYRGTGKSAVARILSGLLQWPLVATDQEIVAEAGMSIPQIVAAYGWDHFRNLEATIVARVAAGDKVVIDTGGGVIMRDENMELLRKNGVVVWLRADPSTIVARIQNDTERPSLTGNKSFLEEVEEVLQERAPRYARAAEFVVETTAESPDSIARRIVAYLECRANR